ncbi:helix-turn-helix domain-containing protein [Pseudonocardia sp.]|uniref:helix-turn-helix domain-containing protein n=1 Tax=Pseudonocardia sp. TaxID=60912 RepID=UPI003D10C752
MSERDGGSATGRPSAGDASWASVNALGGFIRAQRQLAKLSLREMAAMTSVSNAYLSQVERGLHQPSLKVLRSIADALQISTEQLLEQGGWATARTGREAAPDDGEADGGPGSAGSAGSAGSTEAAIRRDPRLTAEQRTALLGVYRSFVEGKDRA